MQVKSTYWWICFGIVLTILAFAIYSPALQFHFWKDDWHFLWVAIYDPLSSLTQRYHPGTSVEFYLIVRVFGQRVLAWQYTGIILRILASLSLARMTMKITKRVLAGILAGLFYCVTVLGFESVVWASAHIVAIVSIFLCLGMSFWIDYLTKKKKKFLFLALLFFLFGLISDPWRAFPVIFFIHLSLYVCASKKLRLRLQMKMFALYGIGACAGSVVGYVSRKELFYSVIGNYVREHSLTFPLVFLKLKIIGHYFNSLGNLIVGWIIPAVHEPLEISHAIYQRTHALVAIFCIATVGIISIRLRRTQKNVVSIFVFFTAWILLFYFPAWMYDPRLITTQVHRYLAMPSIGFIILVAYVISLLSSGWIRFILVILFLIANIYASSQAISQVSFFRSYALNEYIWNTVVRGSSANTKSILVLQGDEPLKTAIFFYHSAFAFALKANIGHVQNLPLVTEDNNQILSLMCAKSDRQIPLRALSAWYLHGDGNLIDNSNTYREQIRLMALSKNCSL